MHKLREYSILAVRLNSSNLMINRMFLCVPIALSMMGCSGKKNADNSSNTNVVAEPFVSVYDTLDQLPIPITLTGGSWNELYMKHLERFGPKPGYRAIDHPYAKLAENDTYKAFIFIMNDESGAPVIMTFDRKGRMVDSISLLGESVINDPANWVVELATINEDLTIHLLDSISTYDLDADEVRIEGSGKLTVNDELYKILDSGKIEKIR